MERGFNLGCRNQALIRTGVLTLMNLSLWGQVKTSELPPSAFLNAKIEQELSMPQSTIQSMLQDHRGFLWFGSQEGLLRFDGYQFEAHAQETGNAESLSNNTIRDMLEDEEGYIWLATYGGGLNRFDPRTERFMSFRNNPEDLKSLSDDFTTCLFRDEQGRLWIGTESQGVCAFDGRVFHRYPDCADSSGRVRKIVAGGTGKLWVATNRGLKLLDTSSGVVTPFNASPEGLPDDNVTVILGSRSGDLWVGSPGVVSRFTPQNGNWRRFESMPMGRVNDFLEDSSGVLWIGADTGIYTLAPGAYLIREMATEDRRIEHPVTIKIFEDQRHGLWFGAFGVGLLRADPYGLRFNHLSHDQQKPGSLSGNLITHIVQNRSGDLWVGTLDKGLNLRVKGSADFEHFTPGDGHGIEQPTIYSLLETEDESIWVVTDGGLYRRPKGQTHFEDLSAQNTDFKNISCLAEAKDRTLWAGSFVSGLLHVDPAQGKVLKSYRNDPNNPESISDNLVTALALDHEDNPWVGTFNGLCLLNVNTGRIERFGVNEATGMSHQGVTCMYLGMDETLWIGTNGGGVNAFDLATRRVTAVFDRQTGMPNDFIMAIASDQFNNLWISTTNGLVRLEHSTKQIRFYDISDGLIGNEFISNACFFSQDNEMIFGSTRGVVSFFPEQVRVHPEPPRVALTRFFLASQLVQPGSKGQDSILKESITCTDQIELGHQQKMFTIEFSALDFANPQKDRFAYRMLGFDDHWTFADARRRFATFTNLDPGDYVLQVRAANADGVWSPVQRELAIHIKPHPLFSTTAKLFYTLIIALVLFGYLRLQRIALKNVREVASRDRAMAQQERRHKERLEQEVQERSDELVEAQKRLITQEKLASLGTLTAGVAHEIRNPLNFVTNFAAVINSYIVEMNEIIERSQQDAVSKQELTELLMDVDESARGIVRHGRRAEEIVKSMLVFAQNRKIEFVDTDINQLVHEFANLAFQSADKTSHHPLDLCFELHAGVGEIPVDPQSLSRVVLNLVSNAFEAVQDRFREDPDHHGEVWVRTARQGDEVYIKVRDNGIGVTAENRVRMFRPFFTTKDRGSQNLGLGLSISYDIVVAQHGGRLEVESEAQIFTEMMVVLPIHQAEPMAVTLEKPPLA